MATTTNQSFNLPTVGGNEDTWGTLLNANWTALDTLLGGVSATEVAILDGATVTTDQLNALAALTTAEIGYIDGVTSAIQTQIDSKQTIDATLTAYASTLTAANKIPYATALDTAGELDFKDEDDMASDSASAVPSQQSVKAYVDATIASEAVVEIVASGSVSDVASLDITGLDTSAYSYELVISNFIPVTDNVDCNLRLSDSALSNFESCWFASIGQKTDGVGRSVESASDTGIRLNCDDQVGSAAGEYGITCTLSLSQASSAPMQVTGNFAYEDNVGVYNAGCVGGGQLATTAINAIRIAFSSGNIESGEYTLYRKAKS